MSRLSGCLDALAAGPQRVLVLRAGVGPRPPLSRRAVAERLGTRVRQVARSERRGLRELRSSARAGRCGTTPASFTTATAGGGTPFSGAGGSPVALAARDGGGSAAATGDVVETGSTGVQEEFRTGGRPDEPQTLAVPADGGGPPAALVIGLAFLAGFAAVWAYERRRGPGGHAA